MLYVILVLIFNAVIHLLSEVVQSGNLMELLPHSTSKRFIDWFFICCKYCNSSPNCVFKNHEELKKDYISNMFCVDVIFNQQKCYIY